MRRRSVKLFRRSAVIGDSGKILKHKCIDIIVELWYYIYIGTILVFTAVRSRNKDNICNVLVNISLENRYGLC